MNVNHVCNGSFIWISCGGQPTGLPLATGKEGCIFLQNGDATFAVFALQLSVL